ncbi:hypothetical protein PTKIN_Ptkin01aG0018300 [Pterospermum kingtungense]
MEVLNISLDGQLRILVGVASDCYNLSGNSSSFWNWPRLGKFRINNTINKFTAIGCDTSALVIGDPFRATGCQSFCDISEVKNGSCSGIGCCETSIPNGVSSYNITLASYYDHVLIWPESPCSYAFVAEDGAYKFSTSDLLGYHFQNRKFPVTLDWTIGDISCKEARKNHTNYACKENSTCVDSENSGYFCKCFDGFEGNPYLSGCQDINECETSRPCIGTCQNLPGNYTCSPCAEGYQGDGKRDGTGCSLLKKTQHQTKRSPNIVDVALGTSSGFLVLLLAILLLCLMVKQRQISKLRETYFEQNGGNLLREQLSKRQGFSEDFKIIAAEELQKATDNYHENRILGKGGQGTVYKGILADNRMVAIKKSRIGDQSQVEPFINEIMVLCQINHRNVVKLLGCCLETQVPLLVYEYVTNGTLFDHLHNDGAASTVLWETRLKIVTEMAQVLSYLHSAASPPIIHRDVKLANILLDENYNAKVSDFGASRLNPSDKAQITTLVQGTLGYLDPEYFHTSQLTEKSDVYSFGVVLIKLLTGSKALSFERPEQQRNLSMYFVSLMKEDRFLEILDRRVMNERTIKPLKEVAALARRCVRLKGEERPTMKEVASELEGLRAMEQHPWGKGDLLEEETAYLLDNDLYNNSTGYEVSTSISMECDSIRKQVRFEIEDAR